jgi:metal-sulfur cluster biosynthetic enzyme
MEVLEAPRRRVPMSDAVRPSDQVNDTLPDAVVDTTARPTPEDIIEALKDVVDPELMVNIVDLGLVYGVDIDEASNVTIDLTLTTPTCPLTDRLEWDIRLSLEGLVSSVTINWVWLPPWTLDNITEDGREQLRAIGYNL